MRARHCTLNSDICQFWVADTLNSVLCGQKEEVRHCLLTCMKFLRIQKHLLYAASKLKISKTGQALL